VINPYKIPHDRMPLIVFSDLSSGLIQFLIKWRTNSSYNHVMLQLTPGEYVSQGNVFSRIPIWRYIKKNARLKFWEIKDLTKYERRKFYELVDADIKLPWWRRRYDYLGVFGQLLGIVKINNPRTMYCSERVAKYLTLIGIEMPKHPSPADLNQLFKANPRFSVYGRLDMD
jgi:hypothetical protein